MAGMTRPGLVLVALAASAAVLLSGCGPLPWTPEARQHNEWIASLHFSQSQAIEGFDDSEYVIDGGDGVREFIDLLEEHGVRASTYAGPDTSGCTGGLSTRLEITYHGAPSHDLTIDSCGLADDTFEAEANAFFAAWREANPDVGLPNGQISAITFSLHQAIEGFDDGEYRQDDLTEIARFVDVLEEYGVQVSGYDDPAEDPCDGGRSAEVTIEYAQTDLVADILIDGCTVDDGFTAAALDLLTEWREDLSAG